MSDSKSSAIAVIGVSARLPGADSLEEIWEILAAGRDVTTEVGSDRWSSSEFFDEKVGSPGRTYSTRGGFLAGVDEFDAAFFGVGPEEARKMDPQQRLSLQEAWRTIENAGYAPEQLAGKRVGVFVGARTGDYHDSILDEPAELEPETLMGHDTSILSARISHFLDLRGPNLTVNTACSSMGVALHLAGQSLRSGEVDLALVGGVHVMCTAQRFLMHSRSRLLSKRGQCRPFDEAADGFVLGEGVGFVLLKSREAALEDGDWIHGNILATAVNHGGHTEKGIAAPKREAQVAVMHEAITRAAVAPETISYIEAHGTGTYKGDAMEARSLREAYGKTANAETRISMGSAKANFGHALTAAVLPGLLRILLSFQHRKLVRQAHFDTANELMGMEDGPFRIPLESSDWVAELDQPRRAALSAFSYSGTNFHMILEEEPSRVTSPAATAPCLILLSGKSRSALRTRIKQLAAWLTDHQAEVSLADVAYTLAVGREHFAVRTAFVAHDLTECLQHLREWQDEDTEVTAGDEEVQTSVDEVMSRLAKHGAESAEWIAELNALPELYRQHAVADWGKLFGPDIRKIPLPGYPFDPTRFWLRRDSDVAPAARRLPTGTDKVSVTLFFSRRDDVYQHYLAAASKTLRDPASTVIQVKCGEGGFRQLGPLIYQINPRRLEDYQQLLSAVGASTGELMRVIHLWNYECEPVDFVYHGNIDRCLHLVECSFATGPESLNLLRRAWSSQRNSLAIEILYLHHGMQPQNGMGCDEWAKDSRVRCRSRRLPDRAASPSDMAALICHEQTQDLPPVLSAASPGSRGNRILLDAEHVYLIDVGSAANGLDWIESWHRAGIGTLVVLIDPDRLDAAQTLVGPNVICLPTGLANGQDLHRLQGELQRVDIEAIHGVVKLVATGDHSQFQHDLVETLLLDELTKRAPLEFFLLLNQAPPSPVSGDIGFAAVFAELRQAMLQAGHRSGATFVEDGRQTFSTIFQTGSHVAPLVVDSAATPTVDPLAHVAVFKRIVAEVLHILPAELDLSATLDSLDFNSMQVVDVCDRILHTFGTELRPSVFYKHKTMKGVFNEWSKRMPLVDAPTRPDAEPVAPKADTSHTTEPEAIAIVGMSGRFPMARDLAEFWENLCSGRDCISDMPTDRGATAGDVPRRGGFIADIDKFDPQFFGISVREAELMDPQQRIFLECVWRAIEDAGHDPTRLAGTPTGVFVGVATCDYAALLDTAGQGRQAHAPIGLFHSIMANRVSYLLDLRGPSQPIDTACSSSLVAVHRAVEAIRHGKCTQAIVGGVNALLTSPLFTAFEQAGMLAEDGRCKTFDERANGYVRGEGVGVLLLKSLRQAQADGDAIYAVIRSSAENHGGHASSLTAPSSSAQADVVARAYREAGIDPRTVGYIEAHGTGTALGDPIEIDGLRQAFAALSGTKDNAAQEGKCGIGSVKTHIGHLEAAAGIAGLIKGALALHARTLPGNLHFQKLNPYVALTDSPFFIVDRTQAWDAVADDRGGQWPRRMGVSSFGFGGVNAHVVLEEYVDPASRVPASSENRDFPILVSAKNPARLREQVEQLRHFLNEQSRGEATPALRDLAYTLQVGRTPMEERLGLVVRSVDALVAALENFLEERESPVLFRGTADQSDPTLALFADDGALQTAVGTWMQQKNWTRLLELWVKGLPVDWANLYHGDRPLRLHLPTYPFARERYWVEQAEPATPPPPRSADRSTCLLRKHWEPAPISAERRESDRVLILADAATAALAQKIQQSLSGSEYHDVESVANPTELVARDWTGFIDLLGCGPEAGDPLVGVELIQQFIEHAGEGTPLLLGVTRGLESFADEPRGTVGSVRAGLYRLLQSEYPAVRSRHLEIDPADNDATIVEQVLAECCVDCADVEVGYRAGLRHRAVLREVPFEVSDSAFTEFPQDRVLWVTGGTRGIGLMCARHWVSHHGVRKVVLTGRTELPPREDWAASLGKPDTVAEKIRAVQELETQGVEVRILSLDLTDADAARQALETVRAELGPVGGVLHCAGSVDPLNPAFIRKPLADIRQVLAAKVAGTDVLLDCFKDEPLAFMVFFSSVSAVVPALGAGVSDYAMANAHLDYAAAAAERSYPVVSVQWSSWKETGMGEVRNEAYAHSGLLSLTDAEGLSLLERVLAAKAGPVVMPVVYDPARWSPERLMQQGRRKEKLPADFADSLPDHSTSAISGPAVAWLTGLFARELKASPERLPLDRPFQDFGMDSILLAQVRKQIERKLGGPMDPSAVFEYPTLAKLAGWLEQTHPDALQPSEISSTAPAAITPEINSESKSAVKPDLATDIAVVGLTGRFPGADNVEAYWRLLAEGRRAINRVPESRWSNPEGFVAGMLDNITDFDPEAFLLSDEDARAMDPQALLVLEESLRLFHEAGYAPEAVKGTAIGVYLGARTQHQPTASHLRDANNPILAIGQNYLAANISRFFDLHGPSLVVDTACSSALMAMNMASQALRCGDVEAAVVGGVSLLTSDTAHRLFGQRDLLSPDGAFHIFDRRAAGVVLSEGVGLVLLKTVAQAEADGDRIHAVIRGLAINNDGRTAGPASPNLSAQKAVMRTALQRSGLVAGDIDYLEANGSGSEVTDLLELKAIEAVYGAGRQGRIQLGSVKPNIGHPLCAEGIVGFIKMVLMLERGEQVPFLSGEEAMVHYDLASSPFEFHRQSRPWTDRVRRAALNCFADGGTNAHVVLENWTGAPAKRQSLPEPTLHRRNLWAETDNPWPMTMDGGNSFLRNHAAHGQTLLPGLAYLDLLYQFIGDSGSDEIDWELSNLTIYHPLTVAVGESVQLDIQREEFEAGDWRVRIVGRALQAEGKTTEAEVLYVTAEMRRMADVAFDDAIDLDAVRASSESTPLTEAYGHFQAKGLKHTGLMRAEGVILSTAEGRIIELSLPEEARSGADAFRFHPTLIDGAAIGAGSMFEELLGGEDRLFLPLYLGRFRATAPIRGRCFARVRSASLRRKNEILYSDLEFFDASGTKIAELTDFAYKLVRQAASLQASPSNERTETPTPEQVLPGENGSEEGGAAGLIRRVITSKLKQPAASVDLRLGYYELGLESAMLLDVVADLERQLSRSLSPTLLFEYATPAELAEHLEATYPTELAQRSAGRELAARPTASYLIESFPLDASSPSATSDAPSAEVLVASLLAEHLVLWIEAGNLKVRAIDERLTPSLREKIASHRAAIAALVGSRRLLPLTRSQKRYWVLSSLQPERSAYNNPIGMRLLGAVDLDRLKAAFRILVNSHHVLRSCCPRLGRGPVLAIAPLVAQADCVVIGLRDTDPAAREKSLHELAVRESREPINPSIGPNLRITLIPVASDDVTLLLTAHHAVFDGYSYLPVMREIMRIYRTLGREESASSAAIVQYENYVLREPAAGDERSARFWREHLAGAPASVELPFDQPRASVNAGRGDTRSLLIDAATYGEMTAAIQERRVTLFAFMLSLLKVAISTWAQQSDLVFGTTVQCRDEEEDAEVIGDFTNFIPIRSRLDPAEPFAALLQRVYQTSLLCLQHKNFPFDEIVELAGPAQQNLNPAYNILVNQLPSISEMEAQLSDEDLSVKVSNNRLLNQSAMLDLRFEWYEEADGLRLICEYNTDLFHHVTIEGFLKRIESSLVTGAYAGPGSVGELLPLVHPATATKTAIPTSRVVSSALSMPPENGSTLTEMEDLLIQKLLELKDIADIARLKDVNFFELGLGSFDVANLSVELEAHFPEFEVADIFKHPTIRSLAFFLSISASVAPNEPPVAVRLVDSPINFDLFRN